MRSRINFKQYYTLFLLKALLTIASSQALADLNSCLRDTLTRIEKKVANTELGSLTQDRAFDYLSDLEKSLNQIVRKISTDPRVTAKQRALIYKEHEPFLKHSQNKMNELIARMETDTINESNELSNSFKVDLKELVRKSRKLMQSVDHSIENPQKFTKMIEEQRLERKLDSLYSKAFDPEITYPLPEVEEDLPYLKFKVDKRALKFKDRYKEPLWKKLREALIWGLDKDHPTAVNYVRSYDMWEIRMRFDEGDKAGLVGPRRFLACVEGDTLVIKKWKDGHIDPREMARHATLCE